VWQWPIYNIQLQEFLCMDLSWIVTSSTQYLQLSFPSLFSSLERPLCCNITYWENLQVQCPSCWCCISTTNAIINPTCKSWSWGNLASMYTKVLHVDWSSTNEHTKRSKVTHTGTCFLVATKSGTMCTHTSLWRQGKFHQTKMSCWRWLHTLYP
jgi:hypothetical protein